MSLDLLEVEVNNHQCWIRSRDITCKVSSTAAISFQKVVTVYIRRVSTALMEQEKFRNSDLSRTVGENLKKDPYFYNVTFQPDLAALCSFQNLL